MCYGQDFGFSLDDTTLVKVAVDVLTEDIANLTFLSGRVEKRIKYGFAPTATVTTLRESVKMLLIRSVWSSASAKPAPDTRKKPAVRISSPA